jgi:DNA polymerase-3 subunit delta'
MGAEAANALLKTLEEPPKNSILILITDQEKMLLPTLISRLQKISLKTLTANQVQQELERKGLNSNQAEVLAQITYGKIGQAIEFASDEKIAQYSKSINQLIKTKDQDKFHRIKIADQIAANLDDLPQILLWWTYFFRNMMQTKILVKKINVDQKIQYFINSYNLKKISYILKKLSQVQKLLSQNINPKLLLENLILEI